MFSKAMTVIEGRISLTLALPLKEVEGEGEG
jgi:hypothetical protein